MNAQRTASHAAWLTGGSLLSGLTAYGFIALGTRTVGAEAFAPVSIVWTLWSASAAMITFPVQHWLIRTAEASGGERALSRSVKPLAWSVAALSSITVLFAGLWGRALFGTDEPVYVLVTALLPIGSVLTGWTRGILAARGRFGPVAAVILGENLLRIAPAVALTLAGATTPIALAVCILCGFSVVLMWPSSFRLGSDGADDPSRTSPLTFMAGIAGGAVAAQLVLTAGPLVLSVIGGSAVAVTSLFSAMALLRSPYMVATGVATRLTQPLTNAARNPDGRVWRRMRATLVAGTAAGSLLAVPFGSWLFPPLLAGVFGSTVSLPTSTLVVLSVGGAVSIGTLVYTLLFVAMDESRMSAYGWGISVLVALIPVAVLDRPLERVVWAFLAAEVAAFIAMMILELRTDRSAIR